MKNFNFTGFTSGNETNTFTADVQLQRSRLITRLFAAFYFVSGAVALVLFYRSGKARKLWSWTKQRDRERLKMIAFASLSALLLLVNEFVMQVIYAAFQHMGTIQNHCTLICAVDSFFFLLGVGARFLFLWSRQRCLYKQDTAVRLRTRAARAWNAVTIVLLVPGGLVTWVLVFRFTEFDRSRPGDCFLVMTDRLHRLYLAILFIMVTGHVILAALLHRSLAHHRRLRQIDARSSVHSLKCEVSASRLRCVSARLFVATAVCALADIASFLAAVLLLPRFATPYHVKDCLLDSTLVLGIVAIVFSLDDLHLTSVCSSQPDQT